LASEVNGGGNAFFERLAGFGGVAKFEGKETALAAEDRAIAEVFRDRGGIECGRHDEEAEVVTFGALEVQEEREGKVAFDVTLVKFVQDYGIDLPQIRIRREAAIQDAFSDEA
jgi:hypothetical protein